MKVAVEDISSVEKYVNVELPPEEVNKVLQKVTQEVGKKAKVKGFREGKVPIYLVKRLFREEIIERGLERLIEETLPKAIKEAGLRPILQPTIEKVEELKEGAPFSYKIKVEIMPEIDLKREDYIGIEVEKEKVEVSEEEVNQVIEELRYSFAEIKPVEDKDYQIKERDFALVSFVAYDGDKPVPGHQADALFIDVGTGEFNKKVEEELIGKKVGDKFTVEVEYPEDSLNPLLAGKKIRYDIEVKGIYVRQLKELNDEFVKELKVGAETVEELKEKVKNNILKEKEARARSRLREKILEKILEKVNFEVPERYVKIKLNQLIEQVAQTLERDGFSLSKLNIPREKLEERLRKVAERQAREEFILDKISELENIEIPEEEIQKEIEKIAKGLNISMDKARDIVYFNILPKKIAEKTLTFLEENARIIEVSSEKKSEEKDQKEETKAE